LVELARSQRTALDAFHQAFYDTGVIWKTRWLGHAVIKNPFDLWLYQELIVATRPDFIVECGTFSGGSALYFATICDLIGHGQVITIDPKPEHKPAHRRVKYIVDSSTNPETVVKVERAVRGRSVMVSLDSDHSRDHVLEEMRLYAPLVTPGSYLVVEDVNVNGHPVLADFGPGPAEAVEEFLGRTDAFLPDPYCDKFLMTFNAWLRRKA
jgi:cephalosporin hydroxylase